MARPATVGLLALTLVFGVATRSLATPDLRASRAAGLLTVYADDGRRDVFYYGPGDLRLATASDGTPDLHLLYTRYIGTVAAADPGARIFRSVLTFTVVMQNPSASALQDARAALVAGGAPSSVEVRPLPIRRVDAALAYTPIGGVSSHLLSNSELEHPDGEAGADVGTYWRARTFAVGLDPETAQLLWRAMEQGQVAMSVGYAFYAQGLAPDRPLDSLEGSAEIVEALRKKFDALSATPAPAQPTTVLVSAGAFAVTADRQKWPELFRRIDITASLPPAYGVLPVYCYDFNNELRPDLYEIDVDLDAEGISGRRVLTRVVFSADRPDVYARSVRFAVAVRLDRPYRFRTLLVTPDGDVTVGPWQSRDTWGESLVIATRPGDTPEDATQGDKR
jgi:hypothetical protein